MSRYDHLTDARHIRLVKNSGVFSAEIQDFLHISSHCIVLSGLASSPIFLLLRNVNLADFSSFENTFAGAPLEMFVERSTSGVDGCLTHGQIKVLLSLQNRISDIFVQSEVTQTAKVVQNVGTSATISA